LPASAVLDTESAANVANAAVLHAIDAAEVKKERKMRTPLMSNDDHHKY